MKNFFLILAVLCAVLSLPAQTNMPIRLALISETDEALPAADLLTAKFSSDAKIQLLERDQIEKVYHEQGLSAVNKNYLKLGEILGADGLLILDVNQAARTTNLTVRLIAVKPGVVLADDNFSWPVKEMSSWAEDAAKHIDSFLPKLHVSRDEAIPISVVNLRSAINSKDGAETERELKLLMIRRLSQERQIFVLERQKMQLLGEEKDLQSDDSAFWIGSYLLDGVIDQNGYSPETVTINAHLTSAKNGGVLSFEVSGSRTNLSAVVNQLADKVNAALKINSSVPAWNATDEAANFYEEAKWAMRWGIFSEAQAAAESAWALGKPNQDYNRLRIETYVNDLPDVGPPGEIHFSSTAGYRYVQASDPTDPKDCDKALDALECYYNFIYDHTNEIYIKKGNGYSYPSHSDWYQLGIETVSAASKVLQHFNYHIDPQGPATDKLADLRALTRSTVQLIEESPSVHNSYFIGDRIATSDELVYTVGGEDKFPPKLNIFLCAAKWGCFWQETPEDCLALYRGLMVGPAFRYIHDDFWKRDLSNPRLIGWNENDRQRIPQVWNQFLSELENSTNVLWRMEAKGLERADAQNDTQRKAAEAGWWDIVRAHRAELVGNNVDLFYLGWGFAYNAETSTMNQEYWDKTVPMAQTASVFVEQKKYLADFTPYDFQTFVRTFSARNYTKIQAAELLPLIISYKSNLLAQARSRSEKFFAQANVSWIEMSYENEINKILNPPAATPPPQINQTNQPPPVVLTKPKPVTAPIPTEPIPPITNVVAVTQFLPIPLGELNGDQIDTNSILITAHHWFEGKLLLDFKYTAGVYSFDENRNWNQTRYVTFPAIAMLDSSTKHWNVIACPEVGLQDENRFYSHSVFLHDDLFTSNNGQIKKYDFQNRRWQVLPISDGDNYELFVVNGQFYAANEDVILKINDGGKSTQILASNRRQPPASALDKENFGTPILFAGANHSLCVIAKDKIYTWNGNDWGEEFATPSASSAPELFLDGILFRQTQWNKPSLTLTCLATEDAAPELFFWQKPKWPSNIIRSDDAINQYNKLAKPPVQPVWQMPAQWLFAGLAAGLCESNLFLLADYSNASRDAKNICDNTLLCFSRGETFPQKIFLKFVAPDGRPPLTGIDPMTLPFSYTPTAWMVTMTNLILFGSEQPKIFSMPASQQDVNGHLIGVWLLPLARINPMIAEQKKIQLAQQAQALAAEEQAKKELLLKTEQAKKDFLAKYDLNHNGLIDRDERENLLDDRAFLSSQLDLIDTNHNDQLDLDELAYFDANQNKILEPKEQAGIEIVQNLLAERLMQKFDSDQDAFLNEDEFIELVQSNPNFGNVYSRSAVFNSADQNHDGRIDLPELESCLKRQMKRKFHPHEMIVPPFILQTQGRQPLDDQVSLKADLERYWHNPSSLTNRPAFHPHPPNQFFHQMPQGTN